MDEGAGQDQGTSAMIKASEAQRILNGRHQEARASGGDYHESDGAGKGGARHSLHLRGGGVAIAKVSGDNLLSGLRP
jgi:hypothetical protein